MFETLFGGLLGGVFRLAPEVLKWLDRKDERKHELDMLAKEMEFAKLRADAEMHHDNTQVNLAQFDAIGKALEGQERMAVNAGKFVSGVSALVRPLITYWVVALWSGVKIASISMAWNSGSWQEVLIANWNVSDFSILSMILTFWFVGRSIENKK